MLSKEGASELRNLQSKRVESYFPCLGLGDALSFQEWEPVFLACLSQLFQSGVTVVVLLWLRSEDKKRGWKSAEE